MMEPTEQESNEERLIGVLLEEALGGVKPPDLEARVRRALAPQVAVVPARRGLRSLVGGFAVGAAAAALLTAVLGLWSQGPAVDQGVNSVVVAGSIEHRSDARWHSKQAAGDRFFWLQASHSVRTSSAPAELQLGELGRLRMHERACFEVMNMSWKDFGAGASLGSVTVAVIAGAIYWSSGGASASASEGEQLVLERGSTLNSEVALLRGELEAAQARVRELESASTRSVVAEDKAAPDPTPATVAAATEIGNPPPPRFTYTGLEATLGKIDWQAMGAASAEMQPLLGALADALDKGEPMSLEVAGEVQKLNGELLKIAQTILEGGIPGEGVNGAFTHPMVVANQLRGVFQHSGHPLTANQENALQAIAAHYTGENEQRIAAYGEDTTSLQRLLDEQAMKERFYSEAKGLLTAEQAAAISHPATTGHGSFDLFGTGIAWGVHSDTVDVATLEDAGVEMASEFIQRAELPGADRQRVEAITKKWAVRFAENLWNEPGTKRRLPFQCLERVERIQEAARIQAAAVQEILATVPMTPAQQAKLRKAMRIKVPVRKG